MVEFGVKLKRAREAQGMTQQTLADQLYVTRQAVSRWECGARFPDLLTAKKLSDILMVSLDELLSGEEQRAIAEKAPLVEDASIGRIQSALYAFSTGAYLLLAFTGARYLWTDGPAALFSAPYSAWSAFSYLVISGSLLWGLVCSIRSRLSPPKIGILYAVYFISLAVSRILLTTLIGFDPVQLISVLLCSGFALILLRYFFHRHSRFPFLICAGASLSILSSVLKYIQVLPLNGSAFFPFLQIMSLIHMIADVSLMGLLLFQAYTFYKKQSAAQ